MKLPRVETNERGKAEILNMLEIVAKASPFGLHFRRFEVVHFLELGHIHIRKVFAKSLVDFIVILAQSWNLLRINRAQNL